MSALENTLERTAHSLENSAWLDAPTAGLQAAIRGVLPTSMMGLLTGRQIGHPLHPALVALPIGAFSAVPIMDLRYGTGNGASRSLLAIGLLTSLPAAAAGLADWSSTDDSQRRVGAVHAALNSAALALLTSSLLARRAGRGGLMTTLAGVGLLSVSGWLGGHLAYRLGTGVATDR